MGFYLDESLCGFARQCKTKQKYRRGVKMEKQDIIESSKKNHEYDRIFYTSCPANGCWDSACILKCRIKDGKIVSIEPDDTINKNSSREDCGWENIWTGQVQMRPCAMGHAWRNELYAETRLLHPMKRVGKKGAEKATLFKFLGKKQLTLFPKR